MKLVIAIRGGVFQNLAFYENRRFTLGLGVAVQDFRADVSYEYAQEKNFKGNLRISVSYAF